MKMKKAFTLMEVNLAILIMAGGILSVVGLYSLGFRETRQSSEDVAATAYADAVISPLATALSATNIKWSVFRSLPNYPKASGWGAYFNSEGVPVNNPDSIARGVFDGVMGKVSSAAEGSLGFSASWPSASSGGLSAGLVVMHEADSPVVKIAFRAAKLPNMLLASPLYYTEVRFQGLPEK